jgi:chromosome partitioning protein
VKTIAVVNQKGGVGKTTTSINLAAALGNCGYRVLLVDLDPQANATSGLGFDKNKAYPNIYRVLLGQEDVGSSILATPYLNLFLLPSHPDLTGAEIELVSVLGREFRLKESLLELRSGYQYIIIDCPPSLNILTVNALASSDYLLIPIQCEYYALEGISQLLGVIKLVQERLNPRLTIGGILLTMNDVRTNLSRQVIEEVKSYFGARVYRTIIPRNIKLGESPSFGRPIMYYDITSTGATSYINLASEIISQSHREMLSP